jgi:hypothetical protein
MSRNRKGLYASAGVDGREWMQIELIKTLITLECMAEQIRVE